MNVTLTIELGPTGLTFETNNPNGLILKGMMAEVVRLLDRDANKAEAEGPPRILRPTLHIPGNGAQ